MASEIDLVMRRFRPALDKADGDRIERVVLFWLPRAATRVRIRIITTSRRF